MSFLLLYFVHVSSSVTVTANAIPVFNYTDSIFLGRERRFRNISVSAREVDLLNLAYIFELTLILYFDPCN